MKSIYRNLVRDFKCHVRKQYLMPSTSFIAILYGNSWELESRPVVAAVIRHLDIQKDDNVMEIGFGRGFGVSMALQKVLNGNGAIFGIERSNLMVSYTELVLKVMNKRLDQLTLMKKAPLHHVQFGLLPVYENFFDSIYHVDAFYDWSRIEMKEKCREFMRALKPGCAIVCGMELQKLQRLNRQGILKEEEYEPMRYMEELEKVGFQDIQFIYEKIDKNGELCENSGSREIQLVIARKPINPVLTLEADSVWKELEEEMDFKRVESNVPAILGPQKTLRELENELLLKLENEKVNWK